MKYKFGALVLVLFVIFYIPIIWLVNQNNKLTNQIQEKDIALSKTNEEKIKVSNQLYDLSNKTSSVTDKKEVIKPVQKIATVSNEDQCKINATKFYKDNIDIETTSVHSFKSHWNTNLKACLIEVTKSVSDISNSNHFKISLAVFDITHDKYITKCEQDVYDDKEHEAQNKKGECFDSIFLNFEQMYMNQ